MSAYGIAVIPVLIWIYLVVGRGGFWRVPAQCAAASPAPVPRRIVVVIPARNEAPLVGAAVASLLRQEFNGTVHLIVSDDGSSDDRHERHPGGLPPPRLAPRPEPSHKASVRHKSSVRTTSCSPTQTSSTPPEVSVC